MQEIINIFTGKSIQKFEIGKLANGEDYIKSIVFDRETKIDFFVNLSNNKIERVNFVNLGVKK